MDFSEEPLLRLKKGNERFYSGLKSVHSLTSAYRLGEIAEKGQNPFAIIICCSDARVPAETVFDQGLGDLFVIRVAGNVINDDMIASLELAVLTFNTPLCLVMGHTQCGAITASVNAHLRGEAMSTKPLQGLIDKINPSIQRVKSMDKANQGGTSKMIENVGMENVKNSIKCIVDRSKIVKDLLAEKKFSLEGSIYDVASGKVQFF